MPTAADIIRRASNCARTPKAGYYRETFSRHPGRRSADVRRSTAIYFPAGARRSRSAPGHRIDAVEVWHYYGGQSRSTCAIRQLRALPGGTR